MNIALRQRDERVHSAAHARSGGRRRTPKHFFSQSAPSSIFRFCLVCLTARPDETRERATSTPRLVPLPTAALGRGDVTTPRAAQPPHGHAAKRFDLAAVLFVSLIHSGCAAALGDSNVLGLPPRFRPPRRTRTFSLGKGVVVYICEKVSSRATRPLPRRAAQSRSVAAEDRLSSGRGPRSLVLVR